jgi:prophage regulatory protein
MTNHPQIPSISEIRNLFLLKLPEVRKRRAQGTTAIYQAVKDGELTPPIKMATGRSSAWPAHEIDAINAALIAGKSKAAIRKLVSELIEARSNILPQTLATIPAMARHEAQAAA